MCPASLTCPSPSRSITARGDSPLAKTVASTALALVADTRPASTSPISSASPSGVSATSEARSPSAACWFSSRLNSPVTQLAADFGAMPAATTPSKYSASATSAVSTPASYSDRPSAST